MKDSQIHLTNSLDRRTRSTQIRNFDIFPPQLHTDFKPMLNGPGFLQKFKTNSYTTPIGYVIVRSITHI